MVVVVIIMIMVVDNDGVGDHDRGEKIFCRNYRSEDARPQR